MKIVIITVGSRDAAEAARAESTSVLAMITSSPFLDEGALPSPSLQAGRP
ncbi:hypothetical protein [Kibdelosporangium philippinense]